MLRNTFLILLTSYVLLLSIGASAACGDPASMSPQDFLKGCAASSTNAVPVTGSMSKEGTQELVIGVAERILQFGALFAIGAIVFSGIRYVTSAGEDEKLKTAKNTAVYAIIGLILTLTAFPLIDIVVNFIYSLGT